MGLTRLVLQHLPPWTIYQLPPARTRDASGMASEEGTPPATGFAQVHRDQMQQSLRVEGI
ncbi:hypothetical protein BC832DRAFT_122024 [Gaertneriomyces semiglobifer]|nr:hypothetical protein BC832DRAFT_122024 [Gaertneriomyces semiglobifer]